MKSGPAPSLGVLVADPGLVAGPPEICGLLQRSLCCFLQYPRVPGQLSGIPCARVGATP